MTVFHTHPIKLSLNHPPKEAREFLTEPKDMGAEYRCYVKDPDGHIIEVGQIKDNPTTLSNTDGTKI
jgi:hypothetical protein